MKQCKKHMLKFDKVCPKCNENTLFNFEDKNEKED